MSKMEPFACTVKTAANFLFLHTLKTCLLFILFVSDIHNIFVENLSHHVALIKISDAYNRRHHRFNPVVLVVSVFVCLHRNLLLLSALATLINLQI